MKMQNEKTYLDIRTGEICYYLFWIIMSFAKGTGLYEGMWQYNLCLVLSMLFLGGKLLLTRYKLADLLWMMPLTVFGLWIYFHSGDQSALILAAMMIGLKGISLPRVFGIGAVVWGSCFCYMILRTFCGGDPGPVLAHEKLGLGPILRWSLGYTHPNVLHITYAILAAFLLYLWNLKPGRSQMKICMWLMAGNVYVFLYSVSFTGVLFMTFLLLLHLWLCGRRKIRRGEKALLQCCFPICILFSVAGPLLLDGEGELFQFLTHALNNRYSASKIYFREMGLSLWGTRVESHGFAIDCSYVEALLSYGGIFFLLIVIGYLLTIHSLIRREDWSGLSIVLSLLVAGVSEPFLFNASFKNITVLFVGQYLFSLSDRLSESKNSRFLGKELGMLSSMEHLYRVPYGKIRLAAGTTWEKCCKKRATIILVAALAFLISMGMMSRFAWRPDSIYVGIRSTDCADQEEKYLDMEHLPENFQSAVYGYVSPKDPLYEFKGNMLTVEYARKIISAGIWGAAAVTAVYVLGIFVGTLEKRRKMERRT